VVQIKIPPLRERKQDIPLLAEYFFDRFKREKGVIDMKISDTALKKMMDYDWPGNVRELRNAIERAVVMGNDREVLPEDLPISRIKPDNSGMQIGLTLKEALDKFKLEFIKLNLEHTGGNRSKAAKIMDIQRTYLSRLISQYSI
jgi:Nif-specific regulatory protein